MITASPLTWPAGWPRTDPAERGYGRFGKREKSTSSSYAQLKSMTVAEGTKRIQAELDRMRARDVIISTNLKLRVDGLPRSDQREPVDPGAAVYWTDRSGAVRNIAIDQYTKVADNLAAIAATLDAFRTVERHGGAEIGSRAFTGFTAIEHSPEPHWSTVLGVDAQTVTLRELGDARRRKLSEAHPDKSGNADGSAFDRVNRAFERAQKELQP